MPIPGGWELILILVVLVLLFGAKKLPDMARSIGQSARVFKGEMKGMKDENKGDDAEAPAASTTPPVVPAALPPAAPVNAAPVPAAPVTAAPVTAAQDAPQPAAQPERSTSGQ